jgi:type I restriction enzyme M protein
MTKEKKNVVKTNGANLGFEQKLWAAADKLRGHMDAAEYKHIVLGLIFLKYISDAFEEKHAALVAQQGEGADPEDQDEYRAENIFWVPKEARWSHLLANAKQPTIGRLIDDAMVAIERDNPRLKGVLPKDYARPQLDKQRLGELIDLIGTIDLGDKENRSKDILGRVYEYFLGQFASAEGKKGGQFYTPCCVVRLLVEMLAPYKGRVFDPCCGSGGIFVSSEKFVEAHGGQIGDISIYGQESNHTTWRLAVMNLAIRGIEANLGKEHADSFHRDLHPDLKADYILANPPFNDSDWGGARLREDKRWVCGVPPVGNANFAWVSHFIHHLTPMAWLGLCWRTAPCHPIPVVRARSGKTSSRRTWWTAWWLYLGSSSTQPRSRPVSGSLPVTRKTAKEWRARSYATARARPSLLMPARWAGWWTGCIEI